MKNALIFLTSLISILFLLSFLVLKKDYQVITARFDKNSPNIYPKDCFIRFENKNFLTTNRWVYQWNILSKRITPHSESILVEKFDLFEHSYSTEEKKFAFLYLKEEDNAIKYQGKLYKIDYKSGDSIFSKINDDEIIIFINSKNLD
jgi:hypothetical protein